MNEELIGYTEHESGFEPLYAPPRGSIVTQAFIHCSLCGSVISGHGGICLGALCVKCYTDVMMGSGDD